MSIYISLENIRKVFDQAIETINKSQEPVRDFGIPNPDLGYQFMFGGFGKANRFDAFGLCNAQIWFYPSTNIHIPGLAIGLGSGNLSPEGMIENTLHGLIVAELIERHRHHIPMMMSGVMNPGHWVHMYFREEFGLSMSGTEGFLQLDHENSSALIQIKGDVWTQAMDIVAKKIKSEKRDFAIRFPGENNNPVYRGICDALARSEFDRAGQYRGCDFSLTSAGRSQLLCNIKRSGTEDGVGFLFASDFDDIVITSVKNTHKHVSSIPKNSLTLDAELQTLAERMFDQVIQ